MKSLNVGKIVNTFGIKGELKIVTRFEMPQKVFKKGSILHINNTDYIITNVRFHHHNYLIELNNIKDINQIEFLKGYDVFFNEEDLHLKEDEYIISELLDYKVISNNQEIGKVTDFDNNIINPLIKINNQFYIPLKGNYIIKIDKENKTIYAKDLEGLII